MFPLWTFSAFWSWFWFFFVYIPALMLWIWVFVDIFRRPDISGLAKAGWVILVIVLPIIGSLIYLAARPSDIVTTNRG